MHRTVDKQNWEGGMRIIEQLLRAGNLDCELSKLKQRTGLCLTMPN